MAGGTAAVFNPVPEAEPDDGLLDVLVVEKVNLLQVATVVGHYQKGPLRRLSVADLSRPLPLSAH